MGDVVGLRRPEKVEETEPHLAGVAKCLACAHEWSAVAPVPCNFLECPACGCVKGAFKYEILRGPDHWVCPCENSLFVITSEGTYCPNCGDWQKFPGHGHAS